MKNAPRISEAEWQVMKAVWGRPATSAQEVIDRVGPKSGWTPATVKTLLNRLHTKGALRFEKAGKSYRYTAAFQESDFMSAEADSFLERFFGGGLSPMLAHFVKTRKLSKQEIAELERVLREGGEGP